MQCIIPCFPKNCKRFSGPFAAHPSSAELRGTARHEWLFVYTSIGGHSAEHVRFPPAAAPAGSCPRRRVRGIVLLPCQGRDRCGSGFSACKSAHGDVPGALHAAKGMALSVRHGRSVRQEKTPAARSRHGKIRTCRSWCHTPDSSCGCCPCSRSTYAH